MNRDNNTKSICKEAHAETEIFRNEYFEIKKPALGISH